MSAILDSLEASLSSMTEQLPPPLQVYCTKANVQLLLRIVVIILTFLLFQPRLAALFRQVTGMPDERQEELKARLEFLKQQKEGRGGQAPTFGKGKMSGVGVVGKDGQVHRVNAPSSSPQSGSTPKGKSTRRKG